jgi:hypothetical protein
MRIMTRDELGNRKHHEEEDETMFVRSAELELTDRSFFEEEFRNRNFHFRVQLLFAEIEPLRGDWLSSSPFTLSLLLVNCLILILPSST